MFRGKIATQPGGREGFSDASNVPNLTIWGGKISAPPVGQVTSETRRSLW